MSRPDPDQLQHLPGLPRALQEILVIVNDAEATLADVAAALAKDPGCSARVVAAANAAFLSAYQPVDSVNTAAMRLGLNRVRVLASTALLSTCFRPDACPGFEPERFWRASMNVALCSAKLVHYVPVERGGPASYLVGLLHNIGLLVTVYAFPEAMDRVFRLAAERGSCLEAIEVDELGFDHHQAAQWVLERWQLPEAVVQVVANHADPDYRGDWARLAAMVGAARAWYQQRYQAVPADAILRGIARSKLENIALSCRNEDAQLHAFASRIAAA
ncbi:MAG: HDOD domain-containing protein [Ectothiorhodospiraceae bacterium]